MRVMTFSREYPSYHPKSGEPTWFVEKIVSGLIRLYVPEYGTDLIKQEIVSVKNLAIEGEEKWHTIRSGNRWKVGDWFSARVWSGKPYRSKQIEFAKIQVKKVWDFELSPTGNKFFLLLNNISVPFITLDAIARNDGLSREDFNHWFGTKKIRDNGFKGQIICWSESINYY